MTKFIKILFISFITIISSCKTSQKIIAPPEPPKPQIINLALNNDAVRNRFINMDYGIKLNIKDKRTDSRILNKHDKHPIYTPSVSVEPEISSFVNESLKEYMKTLGFSINSDIETDYLLDVTIDRFQVNYIDGLGWSGSVVLNLTVYDNYMKPVYPNTTIIGRYNREGLSDDYKFASNIINKAYQKALNSIEWDRIAYFLRKADHPSLEKNKQVEGNGDTALEDQVITWQIYSSPNGADIYWRIISSTNDVKNTNRNYLGSTPYESTETFDIIGLTYNNSGNIQVEITCEKDGYTMQKKKFNLRQLLDQKEVSTKFNLVKYE